MLNILRYSLTDVKYSVVTLTTGFFVALDDSGSLRQGKWRSFRYNPVMLRFFTAGESHGEALIANISGLPAGIAVSEAYIDRELWRRQQGFGRGGRMRIEHDHARILERSAAWPQHRISDCDAD